MKLASTDVVVIGGGVIGAASAYYLAKAGLRVTLVERRGLAHEASGANVGLVTLFTTYSHEEPDTGPFYHLARASADAYLSLGDEVGLDIEYERSGGVVFADTEEKLRGIRRAYEGYHAHGVPVEWLDPDGVRACEPAFSHDGILGGVFCPLNGYVNPMLATRAFALGARQHGATLLLGTVVQGIACDQGRVQVVQTSAGDIPCAFVVNAAGAWGAAIGAMVGVKIPVIPARGQILLTEPAPRIIRRVVSGGEPAARQTRRGNVLIGSMVENVGFDKGVTTGVLGHFARGILLHFPKLQGLQVIRTWAGLRPASPDHNPIIQLLEEPSGFCLATGHSKRGMIQAGGTGQLVAELILGKSPFLSLAPFSLGRFGAGRPVDPVVR
jgi:glycine/D-amino acid oxidase-like deaminating enzyme